MEFRTKSVFVGVSKDTAYDSVVTPIYPTSTFRFEKLGQNKGYEYTRSGNPTRSALEENVAALENGIGASATATGMAAITAVMFLCRPGAHVVAGNDIYAGTYRLFTEVMTPLGISFSFIDMRDIESVRQAVRPETQMIWIETPSNPLLHIVDLEAVIGIAKAEGLISVVDNTFLSPYFQRPIEFGADLVVHSTTKYLNGHSDVVGGAIVFSCKPLEEKVRFLVNTLGVSQAPLDAWLVLRGIKTLACRMEAHQENAFKIADYLEAHPRVKKVYFPGLSSHPQRELIGRQMKGAGGMLAFELDTKRVPLDRFFERLRIFQLAESLGGVESLIEHPWSMSHASMGVAALSASGISEETIRISVGLEDAKDLIEELEAALSQ